ncbi:hypothetical protein BGX38DRAFT_1278287 [Terfezia claveryi]|nr:hypothetical protein BGX38DRAFT_1278287 [Terfezia claveryi]
MSTSFTFPIMTPNTFGRQIWAPPSPTPSTGSSGSESDALSDISVYSQPPFTLDGSSHSHRHTQDMVDMAEGIIKRTPRESEAVVLAVGSEERIKEYVTKTRRNTKAATRFRSVTIREIAVLIFTYIGYESVPKTPEPDYDDNNLTSYFLTRNDYTRFLHCEVSLVAHTLQLANIKDTHTLIKFVRSAFLKPLNETVHTVTLSDALEAISWLKTTSLTKVSITLGWTEVTDHDVSVFITAARKLLPDFALEPGFTLTKANSGFSLKPFVLHAREKNTTLMGKARAWGIQALATKRKRFFDKAKEEGLVPSVQDLDAKASKDEVNQELDKKASKEDTEAELEQLRKGKLDTEAELEQLKKGKLDTEAELEQLKKGKLDTEAELEQLKKGTEAELEQLKKGNEAKFDGLKGIISLLLKGHPMAEEIGAKLQNV